MKTATSWHPLIDNAACQHWRLYYVDLPGVPAAIVEGNHASGYSWWIGATGTARGWNANARLSRNAAIEELRCLGETTPDPEPDETPPPRGITLGSIVVGAYTERGGRAIRGFVIGRPFGDHEPDEWIVYWPVRDGGIGESLEREHEIRLTESPQ